MRDELLVVAGIVLSVLGVVLGVAAVIGVQVLMLAKVLPDAPWLQLAAFVIAGDAGVFVLWCNEKGR